MHRRQQSEIHREECPPRESPEPSASGRGGSLAGLARRGRARRGGRRRQTRTQGRGPQPPNGEGEALHYQRQERSKAAGQAPRTDTAATPLGRPGGLAAGDSGGRAGRPQR
eukprot:1893501-Pyramimonas_sp.AAC.1